ISKLETKFKSREQALEKKLAILDKKESDLERLTEHLSQEEIKYKKLISECEITLNESRRTLENIANLSQEEAKRELVKSLESEARKSSQETIRKIEEEARQEGEKRAQSMISLAVQRVSSEYVNDSTITVVGLPSDDMKGRIIGREGRNIRAIEQSTGVDLIIDDTPEAVILSCFNPIRREIAKVSLERLIADGRIHPARIDETVKKVTSEFNQIISENGEQAAFDSGITDLHPQLLSYLGKLKYRTSGQQTVLRHSVEVAYICGIMAGEMGIDVKQAKRCGLLHDIGKSVDQETEGHHADIGADLCKKFNESPEIIEAIRNHHNENLSHALPLTVVLNAANILSGNRPGARREILETYIKRLSEMENMINSYEDIDSSFVIQSGREIRAIIKPSVMSDTKVTDIANDIAFKLRKEFTFPGQIKVSVIRENTFVDYAK
ncbi:MAG: ribonuclease Y, partial [Oligoflexales bacterium]|nr:ribonuclease Y [Oligoflexales bacterium]